MWARRSWAAPEPDWGGLRRRAAAHAVIAFRLPVEHLLSLALRRAARQRGLVDRLGAYRSAAFRIAPTDLPVAFSLEPDAGRGRVRVVRHTDPGRYVATVSGPLLELLELFDGSLDADAAFFGRTLRVEGDTEAVVALHNALEAADLNMADLVGLPFGRDLFNAAVADLRRAALRRATTTTA
ncbi:MAG TPA: SCP2 sterol-binding domain-containing protein [Caulobacteraceae bacterium]